MRKQLFVIALAIFVGGIFFLLPPTALAQGSGGMGGTVTLSKNETVNNDYFAAGGTVTLSGTVNGDAFLTGGSITVDGIVNGDLLVAGGTVSVSGRVTDNIRLIGGQVSVSGDTGRNASIIAGTANIGPSARVTGNLAVLASETTVGGEVGGNANIADNQLTLGSKAKIGGSLTYLSQSDAQIQSGASVAGATTHNFPPGTPVPVTRFLATLGLLIVFGDFLSALIIGMVLIGYAPVYTQRINDTISRSPGRSLGFGILILIVVPIIVLILLSLVITIPLALILLAFYLINLYVTKIFVFLLIGQLILGKRAGGWALTLGLVIYEILTIIPFLAGLVMFLTTVFGLGAIFLGSRNLYLEERAKKMV